MAERTWGSRYRNTVICIDSYDNAVPVGRISNPYLQEPLPFHGVIQFLKQMEKLLNSMKLPQSFTEMRRFSAPTEADAASASSGATGQNGLLATFLVNVIFRQNASWQGTLTWVDARQEESFRSALELLLLIDSALNA